MISKRRLLRKSRLYLILDKKTVGRTPLTAVANKLKYSGVDLIQLRDKISDKLEILKDALLLTKTLKNSKSLFIINDHVDIAAISCADGVHLGQRDGNVKEARSLLGKNKIIGVSCSNLKQALMAQRNGADYIGIGPIYRSPTKHGCEGIGLKELCKFKNLIHIPYFAIGNINKNNLGSILSAGVKRVALCRAILRTEKSVTEVKTFKALLK